MVGFGHAPQPFVATVEGLEHLGAREPLRVADLAVEKLERLVGVAERGEAEHQ